MLILYFIELDVELSNLAKLETNLTRLIEDALVVAKMASNASSLSLDFLIVFFIYWVKKTILTWKNIYS